MSSNEDAMQVVEAAPLTDNRRLLKAFSTRFGIILDKTGYSTKAVERYKAVADIFGVSPQTAARWLTGDAIPMPALLLQISAEYKTSIDYLLGRGDDEFGQGVELPVFKLKPPTDDSEKPFVKSGTVRFPASPVDSELLQHRCLVVCWSDAFRPALMANDILIVELYINDFGDQHYYILRSNERYSLRWIEAGIGTDLHCKKSNADSSPYEVINLDQFTFNKTRRLDVESVPGKIMVVGRVAGFIRSEPGSVLGGGLF